MATNFPGSLDSITTTLKNPSPTTYLDDATGLAHAGLHSNVNDSIRALEAKVGVTGSVDVNSIDYKINHLPTTSPVLSFRNRIINGNCNIAQKPNVSVSDIGRGLGGVDRFRGEINGPGAFTQSQGSLVYNGVTKNTVRQTVTTAATPSGDEYWHGITQWIEGQNCYDLIEGPMTISFIIKSNISGTFSISIRDKNANQLNTPTLEGYSFASNLSIAANVPERVYQVIPKLPVGATVPNDNGVGLCVSIGFIDGGGLSTSALYTWQQGNWCAITGHTVWSNTIGNFIEITDLQLEKGSIATEFEQRPYGLELALCQRYWQPIPHIRAYGYQTAGQGIGGTITISPPMRTVPSVNQPSWLASGHNATNHTVMSLFNNRITYLGYAVATGGIDIESDSTNLGSLDAEL